VLIGQNHMYDSYYFFSPHVFFRRTVFVGLKKIKGQNLDNERTKTCV